MLQEGTQIPWLHPMGHDMVGNPSSPPQTSLLLRFAHLTSSRPRFSTSFAYYGLAMDLQNFDVNIYVIQLIFGAVDFPAKLVSVLTITFVGRRFTQSLALILAGLAILANILVPRGAGWGPIGGGRWGLQSPIPCLPYPTPPK